MERLRMIKDKKRPKYLRKQKCQRKLKYLGPTTIKSNQNLKLGRKLSFSALTPCNSMVS
jgi:hypothetical protein